MAMTQERSRESTRTAPAGRLPARPAITLALAWLTVFPLAIALEPAAAAAAQPWWGDLAAVGLLAAMVATFCGLAARRTWGAGASLVASGLFVAGVFACPATGHHAFGLWWIGEFALALTLVAVSAVAYLRTR